VEGVVTKFITLSLNQRLHNLRKGNSLQESAEKKQGQCCGTY
jgi:hypothetical protein